MKKKPDMMFVVRKYVKAQSVSQAIQKERKTEVHDIWVDDEWKKTELPSAIGFHDVTNDEIDEE